MLRLVVSAVTGGGARVAPFVVAPRARRVARCIANARVLGITACTGTTFAACAPRIA
jgi:hypothetical protein